MKKLLFACLLSIICLPVVHAQQIFYQKENRFMKPVSIGTGKAPQTGSILDLSLDSSKRSEVIFPIIKDTNVAPKIKGGVFIDAADSFRLYIYNGQKFKRAGT